MRILLLTLILAGQGAFATSEFRRLNNFAYNVVSGGTFLPDLEGERQRIRLDTDRRIAEMRLEAGKKVKEMEIAHYRQKVASYTALVGEGQKALAAARLMLAAMNDAANKAKQFLFKVQGTTIRLDQLTMRSEVLAGVDLTLARILTGGQQTVDELKAECADKKDQEACSWANFAGVNADIHQRLVKTAEVYTAQKFRDVFSSFLDIKSDLLTQVNRYDFQVQEDEGRLNAAKTALEKLGVKE